MGNGSRKVCLFGKFNSFKVSNQMLSGHLSFIGNGNFVGDEWSATCGSLVTISKQFKVQRVKRDDEQSPKINETINSNFVIMRLFRAY